jgi:spore coat polysaccharide biosynthesis protein SpsF
MNLCIIQARMGSSRLPGKVLRDVNGKTILGNVVARLSPSAYSDVMIVATTTLPEDDAIAEHCAAHSVKCFRGSDWDVLDRFYQAACSEGLKSGDNIIRICCDNPLHSYKVLDFVMEQFLALKVEYFSNSNQEPDFLEDGFDVEVTTFDALSMAWREAKLMSEREHVMPYIKNSGRFSLGWRKASAGYRFKLSVDTEADLDVARTIFSELADTPGFSIDEVVDLLSRKPGILELNKESTINSGYQRSLRDDHVV